MTRTGRQFVREVGADPRKWAEYLLERTSGDVPHSHDEKVDFVANIIRDAMEAAIKHARLTAPPLFPEKEEHDGNT